MRHATMQVSSAVSIKLFFYLFVYSNKIINYIQWCVYGRGGWAESPITCVIQKKNMKIILTTNIIFQH